ncbi:hypothetical protein AX16_007076 [Volvariella volvacea WC 439]|nr:hypothetical protein AX16_007076 [Volvariella volvacea WC 439]
MLFFLTSRIIGSVVAFLYPGYASYKTLSQRPASEEELERWLMYWCVLGCIVGVEYVAEWAISWIPFYYTLKTLFLLYLALPQTRGSSYLYIHHLKPFFHTHEQQIDATLASFKARLYAFVQEKIKMIWEHVAISMGQQPPPQHQQQIQNPQQQQQQPGAQGMVSGLVSNIWGSYGPSLLASGAALIYANQAQQQQQSGSRNSGFRTPGTTPQSSYFRESTFLSASSATITGLPTGSGAATPAERRRQLEAELAALSAQESEHEQGEAEIPSASGSYQARLSQGQTTVRGRTISTSNNNGTDGRFEEVDVPSDAEGYDVRDNDTPSKRGSVRRSASGGGYTSGSASDSSRKSWWGGWGSGGSKGGYERVKSE